MCVPACPARPKQPTICPPPGEFDVMEHVNTDSWFNANMHFGGIVGASNSNCHQRRESTGWVPNSSDPAAWHTFSESSPLPCMFTFWVWVGDRLPMAWHGCAGCDTRLACLASVALRGGGGWTR